jgi:hypothetical protein
MLLATAYKPFKRHFINLPAENCETKCLKMSEGFLPLSDLSLLKKQVLDHPPSAALPRNLSDQWIALIGRDLDVCFADIEPEKDAPTHMAAPLALVMCLLSGKHKTTKIQIQFDKLEFYLAHLRAEIALELISRQTNLRINAATLETIFEDRQLLCTRIGENEN